MAGWQPGSPGIWIGQGPQRMFVAQGSGQWILLDVDGAELRRSRTLAGLVAELGPADEFGTDEFGQDTAAAFAGSRLGFEARSSRNGTVNIRSHSTAVRNCGRRTGRGRPTRCCRA